MNKRFRTAVNGESDSGITRSSRWTALLVQAQRGDRGAFDALVDEAQPIVWLHIFHLHGDSTLADDVAGETFARV